MKENLRMFLPEYHERHESVMKKKVRKFILAYKLLEQFLSMGTNPNDEESLHFYSNLYIDMTPVLTEITCYVINNGYIKRRRIKESITLSQKILGQLKILHMRYIIVITSPDPFGDPRWVEISTKSNAEVVEEIENLFEKMYSLSNENEGWDITHPFSFKTIIKTVGY